MWWWCCCCCCCCGWWVGGGSLAIRPRVRGGGTAGSWFSFELRFVSHVCQRKQTDSTYDCLSGWTAALGPDGALGSLSIGAIRVVDDLWVCCLRRAVFQCYNLGLSPVGELRRSLIYLISTFRRVVRERIKRAGDNKCQVRRRWARAMVELRSRAKKELAVYANGGRGVFTMLK